MGVPTYRYKLVAFGVSCALAGSPAASTRCSSQYVTAAETFDITVPLTVMLMSVLGGTRHWAGPALGAAVDHDRCSTRSTAGDHAVAARRWSARSWSSSILFMPDGILGPASPRAGGAARDRRAGDVPPLARSTSVHAPAPTARRCWACAACPRRSRGCTRSTASTSRCARARSWACSGPNGSGKSTLINVVSGHTAPTRGRIVFDGREIAALPAHRIARAGIARTYQIPRLFAQLTCARTSALAAMFGGAQLGPAQAREQARTWLEFTGLARARRRAADELNLHQRKFLELARALASRPRLVLLDEVLSGLTPAEIDEAVAMIRRIRDAGHDRRVGRARDARGDGARRPLVVLDQGR